MVLTSVMWKLVSIRVMRRSVSRRLGFSICLLPTSISGLAAHPNHINVLFADARSGDYRDHIKYALDLGKHWSINWNIVRQRQRVAVGRAG